MIRAGSRPTADTLRAAADRIDALPADVPDPSVEVTEKGFVHVRWHGVDADVARRILAAIPGRWDPYPTSMHLAAGEVMWWINFAIVEPVAVVDARALLAEVAS
jgi:hypothetical protein